MKQVLSILYVAGLLLTIWHVSVGMDALYTFATQLLTSEKETPLPPNIIEVIDTNSGRVIYRVTDYNRFYGNRIYDTSGTLIVRNGVYSSDENPRGWPNAEECPYDQEKQINVCATLK